MEKIDPEKRNRYIPLFTTIPLWRAFIGSVLNDGYGTLHVDDSANPQCAVAEFSGAFIYAGNADASKAESLMKLNTVQPLILGCDASWSHLVKQVFGQQAVPIQRWHLRSSSLNTHLLKNNVDRAVPEIQFRPIILDDIPMLEKNLGWEHHKYHYKSIQDFINTGRGFAAFDNTGRLVCAVSAFARSGNDIEIQVTTEEKHRRKGIALATAARFLHGVVNSGISAPWDAANEASTALARKLGYADVLQYQAYEVIPAE